MSGTNKKAFSGKFTSTALPTGEKFSGSDRSKPVTIDRSNRNPLLKKPVGKGSKGDLDSFNIFKPLSMNGTAAGRCHPDLYTDPFAADRVRYQPPEKKLLEVKRETLTQRRGGVLDKEHKKHVQPSVKDGQHKEKVITANGSVHGGGKQFTSGCHTTATTFDKPDPKAKVNYASMTRFKKSVVAREEQISEDILSPNSQDQKTKEFSKGSNNGLTRAGHGGVKKVDGPGDTQNSLVGVLRLDTKKAARNYDCCPPWGTYATPAGTPGTSVSNSGANTANLGVPTSCLLCK